MEFLGHQKAFSFQLSTGMIITTFVSDRHASIAKWMREECTKLCKEMKTKIEHYYDCWHVAKSKTLLVTNIVLHLMICNCAYLLSVS